MTDNNRVIEKLASLETKVDGQRIEFDARLTKLENNNPLMYRLTVVSEQQLDMGKNQQRQIDKMTDTFSQINVNLTKLNMSQDELREDVKGIVKRVDNFEEEVKLDLSNTRNSIKEVETLAVSNRDRGKFDLLQFFTNDVSKIIFTAIVIALLGYVGLNQ